MVDQSFLQAFDDVRCKCLDNLQRIIRKKMPFLDFLVPLAEAILNEGQKKTTLVKGLSTSGRPSKKRLSLKNIPMHLPTEGKTRRRCARCAETKVQKRTKTVCSQCRLPLYKNCFAAYLT